MIKNFLITIIALVIFSSQNIIYAANYDWNRVPHISSYAELRNYVEQGRRQGKKTFPVILENGLNLTEPTEFIEKIASAPMVRTSHFNDDSGRRVFDIEVEYPSIKIVNAYLKNDVALLDNEELKLLKIATEIVNKAKKLNSEIAQELYIYNQICQRVTYYDEDDKSPVNGKAKNFCTAIGALIDGKANCQGYTDAFYMLCRMCGFNVSRISGKLNGDAHIWNTITFDDGKTYCVDVTDGDTRMQNIKAFDNTYIYFNAPLEIMQINHAAAWDMLTNFQRTIDEKYSYRALNGLAQTRSAEVGLKLIAKKFAQENRQIFCVMTPQDRKFSKRNSQRAADFIAQEIAAYGVSSQITLSVQEIGKYLFFMAKLNNRR